MQDPYEAPKLEVFPGHVIPWNAVVISVKARSGPGVYYHWMSAENALNLLGQLEAAEPTLRNMAANNDMRESYGTPTGNFKAGGAR